MKIISHGLQMLLYSNHTVDVTTKVILQGSVPHGVQLGHFGYLGRSALGFVSFVEILHHLLGICYDRSADTQGLVAQSQNEYVSRWLLVVLIRQ